MNDFQAMDAMSSESKDIRMNGNIVGVDRRKGGGLVTFSVDEDTFDILSHQLATGNITHYAAIYVVNKAQFDKIKRRKP